jgi:predicted nucleotidyltransferase
MFTDYRRRVLGLLLLRPDERYHLREIARLTNTVPGTLARELSKLSEAGLLVKTKVGNQLQYSANKESPIYPELSSILRKTSGLVDVLAEALLPAHDKIEFAFVYGSIASGKANAASDIDIIIIGKISFSEAIALLYPAQTTLGREINPKLYKPTEWRTFWSKKSSFADELRKKPKLFIIGTAANLDGAKQ